MTLRDLVDTALLDELAAKLRECADAVDAGDATRMGSTMTAANSLAGRILGAFLKAVAELTGVGPT